MSSETDLSVILDENELKAKLDAYQSKAYFQKEFSSPYKQRSMITKHQNAVYQVNVPLNRFYRQDKN